MGTGHTCLAVVNADLVVDADLVMIFDKPSLFGYMHSSPLRIKYDIQSHSGVRLVFHTDLIPMLAGSGNGRARLVRHKDLVPVLAGSGNGGKGLE